MDELDCFCFWWVRPKWFMTFLYYRCIYLLQLWEYYYSLIIQNVHFCVMIWGRSISGGIFFVPVIWKRAFVIYLYLVLQIYLKYGLNDVWTSDYTADLFRLLKLTLIQLFLFLDTDFVSEWINLLDCRSAPSPCQFWNNSRPKIWEPEK